MFAQVRGHKIFLGGVGFRYEFAYELRRGAKAGSVLVVTDTTTHPPGWVDDLGAPETALFERLVESEFMFREALREFHSISSYPPDDGAGREAWLSHKTRCLSDVREHREATVELFGRLLDVSRCWPLDMDWPEYRAGSVGAAVVFLCRRLMAPELALETRLGELPNGDWLFSDGTIERVGG